MSAENLRTGLPAVRRCGLPVLLCWTCLMGFLAGCTTTGKPLRECPLSVDEQQQAVLELVPRGTLRAEAAQRLKQSGIEFSTSGHESIFYLSLWDRPNGERWHINVALLFDSSGRLYQARPADSPMALLRRDEPVEPQSADARANSSGQPARRMEPPAADGDEGPERVAFPGHNPQPPSAAR